MSTPGDTTARKTILDSITGDFRVLAGVALPMGVSQTATGLNFSLFSQHAREVSLVLFTSGQHDAILELALDPDRNRTGLVWHIEVAGLHTGTRYGWRLAGGAGTGRLDRFDSSIVLIDPYVRALTGGSHWGDNYRRDGDTNSSETRRRSIFVSREFDWQHIRKPKIDPSQRVIYEVHLRGFTMDPSSGVASPGTYEGFIEKIPYLKELGITTVELLPVYEFEEDMPGKVNPFTGEVLRNFWGYQPISFFAPKGAYASNGRNGRQVDSFKTLVRELHRAGLEIFLDVVFNHTAEGSGGPNDITYSFRGIDNCVYYILDPETGAYRDYSGCGNTFNCNQPVVRELILDALRYWVSEMHVDGFRFDLASILGRGEDGSILANPPLIERIAVDPVLADTTVIAEAWDAAGAYQVGSFPSGGRWAEWNGPFRDDIRQFFRGYSSPDKLATRIGGSSDLYQKPGRTPLHSVNFVTCHDGFTLRDLVSYNHKHNEMNGENNADGSNDNFSWNCGVEGDSDDPLVVTLRQRQMRNYLTVLFLSQGVPMLLAGDELGRTQRGNNNAYCQDNAVSWVDWTLTGKESGLLRFTRELIALRKEFAVLRRTSFLTGQPGPDGRPDVTWHGPRLYQPEWGTAHQVLGMHLAGERDVYLAVNGTDEALPFEIPQPGEGQQWRETVDTSRPSPSDFLTGPSAGVGRTRLVEPRSCLVLTGER